MADGTPRMDWGHPNQADTFKIFCQRLDLFFLVKGITDAEKQIPILLLSIGEEGLRRFNSWNLSDMEKKQAS
jgi:hypothetical protein